MPLRRLIVFALVFGLVAVERASATNAAKVAFHSLSVRFHDSSTNLFGTAYHLRLSSHDPLTDEGELAQKPGAYPTNKLVGFYAVSTDSGQIVSRDDFIATLPEAIDSNHNGLDDFYESSIGLNPIQTIGTFQDHSGGSTTVTMTWSRVAGSRFGMCEMALVSPDTGLTLTFEVAFELLEFHGDFQYDPGGTSGLVNLTQADDQLPLFQSGTNMF